MCIEPCGRRCSASHLARDAWLERRLLVHATEMHTPSGAHARLLQAWQAWQAAPNHQVVPLSPEDGRALLASRLAHLNETCGAAARLAWQTGQTEPGA